MKKITFFSRLVINHHAEIVAFRLTFGSVNDRNPVPSMLEGMKGKAYADKSYMGQKLFTSYKKFKKMFFFISAQTGRVFFINSRIIK